MVQTFNKILKILRLRMLFKTATRTQTIRFQVLANNQVIERCLVELLLDRIMDMQMSTAETQIARLATLFHHQVR